VTRLAVLFQANANRDALSMALFSRTMSAIARRVNSFKRPTSSTVTTNTTQGMGEASIPSPALTNGIMGSPQGMVLFSLYLTIHSFKLTHPLTYSFNTNCNTNIYYIKRSVIFFLLIATLHLLD